MRKEYLKENKVAKNAGWIISCKLCKAVLTLISTMIISRYLGVKQYGIISYVAGLVTFVTPIMKLGLGEILVHELILYPDEEGETLGTTILLNVFSSLVCMFALIFFVSVANTNDKDTLGVCICYSLTLLFQALEMLYYWFQSKLMAKYTSIAILVAYIGVVCIQVILVFFKANIYWIALSYSIEYLLIAVILYVCYNKKKNQKLSYSIRKAKHLVNMGKHYIISGLMVMVFSQTDKLMLKFMCDDRTVGLYAAATTCASMTSFVFVAIIDSMRPIIFSSVERVKEFENKMVSLYSFIIWLSLFQCTIITMFAPLIVHIMFGGDYTGSVMILRIVVWFTTFSYIGTVRNIWILAKGYQKYLWIINLSGALLNVLINLLLIPKYGAVGAAIASVVAQFFTNVIIGYIIRPLRKNNYLMIQSLNIYNTVRNALRSRFET